MPMLVDMTKSITMISTAQSFKILILKEGIIINET